MNKIDKYINWYVGIAILLIAGYGGYLFFFAPHLIINFLYSSIILLSLFLHIVIGKNFNITFNIDNCIKTISNNRSCNFFKLLIKIILFQGTIWLLATWFLVTILSQVNLISNKAVATTHNFNLTAELALIGNLINWIIFVSLLISLGLYKYYFKYTDVRLRLARCLINISDQPKASTFFYNRIANLEAYIRIIMLTTCSSVVTILFFNSMSHRFNFIDFFPYSGMVSVVIIIAASYFKKHIDQAIDFLGAKTSINTLNIYLIMSVISILIIFIFNQLILFKANPLHLINFRAVNLNVIKTFITQEKVIVLFIALNVALMVSVSDLLLKLIRGYKLGIVYLASLIGAIIQGVTCYILIQKNFLYKALNNDLIGLVMLLIILIILKFNFKNIFCFIKLPINSSNTTNPAPNIRTGFLLVIKNIIYMNLIYLASYYMFSWMIPVYLFSLGIIFLLPCIIMLVIKILHQSQFNFGICSRG